MKTTGAGMVVRALEKEGVTHVFGIPGGTVVPLYDALYDASFEHITVRHEQAAAHAADGFARATGRPGVCICTSGPGFTNIITGLATAFSDSIPMVAVAGQVATHLIGTDAFQEADALGSSLPVAKHCYAVRSIEELPVALKSAFELAVSGRPGPVLIDLPVDIQRAEGVFEYPDSAPLPRHVRGTEDFSALPKAASLISKAERPVILVGGGAAASPTGAEFLLRFAEKIQAPVATTLIGKGVFPGLHPLSLGMAGMHGTAQANMALSGADLVIAAGTRFSDRTTGKVNDFAKNAAMIHIDLDAAELEKNIAVDAALQGDAGAAMERLCGLVATVVGRTWTDTVMEWREKYPLARAEETRLSPATIISRAQRRCPDACVTTDVGQNQMWAALHWQSSCPRTFLSSGGLGTMGFGLPAAIGAAFALREKTQTPVLCFAGDGGFLMNAQELDTCARYNLPVKILVLNNGCLGMVRQWQELFWGKRYSSTTAAPVCRFDALAEAFGIPGYACNTLAGLENTLDELFRNPGPALAEFRIDTEENVYPMVPAGAALDSFLYETP